MQHSEQIDQIAAALVEFQGAAPTIEKAKTVSVQMKSGGRYTYDYAPLDYIVAQLRPLLRQHGLAVVQATDIDGGDTMLVTTVLHTSGQYMRYTTPLPRSADIKTHGGNITYIRRYEYAGALGIVTSEDVDALDSGDVVEKPQHRQKSATGKAAARTNGNTPPLVQQPPDLSDDEAIIWNMAAESFRSFVAANVDGYNAPPHVENAMVALGKSGAITREDYKLDTPAKRLSVYRALVARKEQGDNE